GHRRRAIRDRGAGGVLLRRLDGAEGVAVAAPSYLEDGGNTFAAGELHRLDPGRPEPGRLASGRGVRGGVAAGGRRRGAAGGRAPVDRRAWPSNSWFSCGALG